MLYSQCFANKCLIHTHIPVSIYVYTHTHTHIYAYTYICIYMYYWGFPGGSVVKIPPAKQETQVQSWGWKFPWRRNWQCIPVF